MHQSKNICIYGHTYDRTTHDIGKCLHLLRGAIKVQHRGARFFRRTEREDFDVVLVRSDSPMLNEIREAYVGRLITYQVKNDGKLTTAPFFGLNHDPELEALAREIEKVVEVPGDVIAEMERAKAESEAKRSAKRGRKSGVGSPDMLANAGAGVNSAQ